MKYIKKMVLLAGLLGALGSGCKAESMSREVSSFPIVTVKNPSELENTVRRYTGKEDEIVATQFGAWHDNDGDKVEDLYFDTGWHKINGDSCWVKYYFNSSSLDQSSKDNYVKSLERLHRGVGSEAQKMSFFEMYQSLPYPVIVEPEFYCTSGK